MDFGTPWFGRRLDVVLQSETAECGLACLAMIAKYHGYESDLGSLRAALGASLRGVTLAHLMQMCGQLNLSSRALRLEMPALDRLRVPCVLHWNLDHFVVLERVANGRITICDPAVGRRTLSLDEASRHFTGVALEVTPTREFKPARLNNSLALADFFRNVQAIRPTLIKLFALSVALQSFAVLSPFYAQIVIDQVLAARDLDLLTLLAIGFGLVALLNVAVGALRSWLVLYFGAHLQFEWATRLFHHLIRLPISFFEKRHMGDVVSRFRSIQPIQQLVTTTVVEAVIDGLMAISTLAVMLLFSWQLTLVPVAALLVYILVRWFAYQPHRDAAHEVLIKSANENTHFLETLRGMLTIKSMSGEHIREATWQNRLADSVRANVRSAGIATAEQIANQLLFGVEAVLVVWIAAVAIIEGEFSVGMLVAFMAYKSQFTSRTAALIDKMLEYRLASVNLDRLSDIVMEEREAGLDVPGSRIAEIDGALELRNVAFRYSPTDPLILSDVSLDIVPGECVAITGPSGCGKTTLLKVMMGLLCPEAGQVLVDGRALQEVSVPAYRKAIAAVMQEDCLLSGTLADNICFFQQAPDMQRVEQCARMAALHEDIAAMPMGYFTSVGDMGGALSGGQKQRVLLARALYLRPKILFLDEATSHLDPATEAVVHAELKRLAVTRVVIAHRNETIAIADRVIRLRPDGAEPVATRLAVARG